MATQLSFDKLFEIVTTIKGNQSVDEFPSFELFRYSGFDPVESLKKIINAQSSTKMRDIQMMCYLFLARGTNIENIKKRTGPEGEKKITELQKRYSLVGQVRGRDKNALNLARVASCCPVVTVNILMKFENINRPFPVAEMEKIVPNFPRCFMTSIAASLIPESHPAKDSVLSAITLYNMLETKRINTALTNASFKKVFVEAKNYVNISFRSNLVDQGKREELVRSGFFEEALSDTECSDAVNHAAKYLDDHYNSDQW